MKTTGIIMSGDHPKLILNSTKTMTRRTWGLDTINEFPWAWELAPTGYDAEKGKWLFWQKNTGEGIYIKCPYGHIGNLLWVRETWAYINNYDIDGSKNYCEYKADKPNDLYPGDWPADEARANDEAPKWRPSIHMPRWTSRITLEITEVRVEKLQEITYDDCYAEGIDRDAPRTRVLVKDFIAQDVTPKTYFKELWDSLNAKRGYGWEVSPWVWVILFRLLQERA